MITVEIDELTPCLKCSDTGDLVDTESIQITRKSILDKYNRKNGWYINWAGLLEDNEIYALVLKGTNNIQGLVAIEKSFDKDSAYVSWMVAAPENNKHLLDEGVSPKYIGVGGHLFAIAVRVSFKKGFDGVISGCAANEKLLQHYIKAFGAVYIGILGKNHLAIYEDEAERILEAYTYEWTDEKI